MEQVIASEGHTYLPAIGSPHTVPVRAAVSVPWEAQGFAASANTAVHGLAT